MGWNHITLLYHADLKISHVALCVLHVLSKTADETDQCYPSMTYIAEKMNMSVRSVKRGIQELGEAGLVIWKSGRGNRHVNRYQINVKRILELSTNGPHSPIKGDCVAHLEESKGLPIGLCGPLKVTDSPIKGDCVAHGREHKEDIKSVSKCPAKPDTKRLTVDNSPSGHATSAEELPVQPVPKRTEKAPSAPAKMAYGKLVMEYGWKPSNRQEVEAVVSHCHEMGMSIEEAKSFARYNNIRRWMAVTLLVSIHQLAKEWLKNWIRRSPDEFDAERRRRIEIKRIAEIKRQREIVESEKNDNK